MLEDKGYAICADEKVHGLIISIFFVIVQIMKRSCQKLKEPPPGLIKIAEDSHLLRNNSEKNNKQSVDKHR